MWLPLVPLYLGLCLICANTRDIGTEQRLPVLRGPKKPPGRVLITRIPPFTLAPNTQEGSLEPHPHPLGRGRAFPLCGLVTFRITQTRLGIGSPLLLRRSKAIFLFQQKEMILVFHLKQKLRSKMEETNNWI